MLKKIELIEKIQIPARADKFLAADNFSVGIDEKKEVKIIGVNGVFLSLFWAYQVSACLTAKEIKSYRLRRPLSDQFLLNFFGQAKGSSLDLGDIWYLLLKQDGDKKLDTEKINLFYIPNPNSSLSSATFVSISLEHTSDGWYIKAELIPNFKESAIKKRKGAWLSLSKLSDLTKIRQKKTKVFY